ncbi:MAG: ACP S-malonyltransferase [Desulfovibrio sp.]|nr:ACP S-malonyltransferase [Desulfovibrio sp.]
MSSNASCLLDSRDPAQEIANSILDRPAILFSGQGCQEKGMGRDLAEADKEAMDYWIEAEKISGLPLREIYWSGTETEMNDTRCLQPALTVANLNLWNALSKKYDVRPSACAGHSLGEFAALAAAGAISPKSALEITSLRGKLMAEADPEGNGAMAAIIRLDEETVEKMVGEVAADTGETLIAANFNTPRQIVVSGHKNAVREMIQRVKSARGVGVPLQVSGAFHSPLMAEANAQLQPLFEKTVWKDPKFPVYANVDAKPVLTGEEAKKSVWRQMISPVYWANLIRNLYLAGIRWWMEISPRAVLGKMIGPSLAGLASQCDDLRVDLINSLSGVLNYAL